MDSSLCYSIYDLIKENLFNKPRIFNMGIHRARLDQTFPNMITYKMVYRRIAIDIN